MAAPTHVLSGTTVTPQTIETALGPVEFALTEGAGPVVLASHGGAGGVDQARLALSWLEHAQYRLLSLSRPGYLGTPLESGQSIEAQADLFAALLDALRLERTAVVALSSGGPPGYVFAARHPDRVWALVAIDSVSGRHEMPETANPIAEALFMGRIGQYLMTVIGRKKPAWLLRQILGSTAYFTKRQLRAHLDFALGSPDAVDFIQAFAGTLYPYKPRKPGTDNDTALNSQLPALPLEQVRCPALVVHGTHDADVKFYHGVFAHERIAGAERVWIEEGDHLGFWLSPHGAQARQVAREFLDRHRP
jgi:pimeloyl-ACP methyl ester carboxylesterase